MAVNRLGPVLLIALVSFLAGGAGDKTAPAPRGAKGLFDGTD